MGILLKLFQESVESLNTTNFGSILAKSLNEQDRSASWLARKIGVHPSTVSKWLSGETRPSDKRILNKVATVLKLCEEYPFKHLLELSSNEGLLGKIVNSEDKEFLTDDGVMINLVEVPVEIDTDIGKLKGILQGHLKIETSSIIDFQKNDAQNL